MSISLQLCRSTFDLLRCCLSQPMRCRPLQLICFSRRPRRMPQSMQHKYEANGTAIAPSSQIELFISMCVYAHVCECIRVCACIFACVGARIANRRRRQKKTWSAQSLFWQAQPRQTLTSTLDKRRLGQGQLRHSRVVCDVIPGADFVYKCHLELIRLRFEVREKEKISERTKIGNTFWS